MSVYSIGHIVTGTTDMTKALTTEEQVLLQRYYDGDPLPEGQADEVDALLNRSQTARVFMAALEELTEATAVAVEQAWDVADAPDVETFARTAIEAASLADAPLEELAPLLERFWDGEVVPEEIAIVSALADERTDVADYLANLEGLSAGVKVTHDDLIGQVAFDDFWDSLEDRLDAEDSSFDPEEHQVLLYRYHDGEATAQERARVESWIDRGDERVTATLEALGELNLAAVAGIETAQANVDLAGFWHRVEDAIDDEIEAQGENVVSFEREKREKKGFLSNYRQGVFAAVATILVVAFVAGLFSEQLFSPGEKVIVEKTVVIVDSVEYQPGSSAMVNSPMKQASSSATVTAPDGESAEEEEEPTVIWLLDTSENGEAADSADEAAEEPADGNEEESQEQPQTDHVDEQPI